jgi:hypothetical protein
MRLRKLEVALQAAYESRNRIVIKDMSDAEPAPQSIQPLAPSTDARTQALERRIKVLEARIKDLETELEEARANISINPIAVLTPGVLRRIFENPAEPPPVEVTASAD